MRELFACPHSAYGFHPAPLTNIRHVDQAVGSGQLVYTPWAPSAVDSLNILRPALGYEGPYRYW
jgi:hypothetical protein